ncbi:response regulator [Saccharophagus degradans]|uniref:Response regulator receiver n=1 Tax=Saccharophagus degradans (strain 2-40 / ATCC 43961 / DSM 17024) TaxID=203122 RepID=Q21HD9_SACD2|nr:response regulator [Saccharophagus degradans]ABD81890.1 response regulator receiver [Saccharophagus degradans 2-40]
MYTIPDVTQPSAGPIPILIAEDDDDDRLLMQHVFERVFSLSRMHFVEDGQEVLDYLMGQGAYAESSLLEPKLIILDLNMPIISGKDVLLALKANAKYCHIPVVIYSTSDAKADIRWCYTNGAAGYIVKPASIQAMETALMTLGVYWGDLVRLP